MQSAVNMSSICIDGKSDGFGAQYQAKMSGIALSRKESRCYCHEPFKTMEHLDDTGESVADMEAFCGLRSDRCCDRTDMSTVPISDAVHWAKRPSEYYSDDVLAEIRAMYDSGPKPRVPSECDIVIHARRGDTDPSHQYAKRHHPQGDPRFTSDSRIAKTIERMKHDFPGEQICVFSEGKKTDFRLPRDVKLYLNGSVRSVFHAMVSAPRLVIADSSFSYTAGLINQNAVYTTNPEWWHKPLDRWHQLDIDL